MKPSIFYFDDEADCLEVFREMFEGDYEVRVASTLAEARRALARRPADIVISDQMMPEISGTEFLREVARSHPASYRVLLTGGMLVGDAIGEIMSGIVHAFALKPWTEEEKRRVLERATSRRNS
ncbi:MAG: response regulator, partial [Acidobacteria bacterium]|nr:response regulator [Acidobacteriota bacterium]